MPDATTSAVGFAGVVVVDEVVGVVVDVVDVVASGTVVVGSLVVVDSIVLVGGELLVEIGLVVAGTESVANTSASLLETNADPDDAHTHNMMNIKAADRIGGRSRLTAQTLRGCRPATGHPLDSTPARAMFC